MPTVNITLPLGCFPRGWLSRYCQGDRGKTKMLENQEHNMRSVCTSRQKNYLNDKNASKKQVEWAIFPNFKSVLALFHRRAFSFLVGSGASPQT